MKRQRRLEAIIQLVEHAGGEPTDLVLQAVLAHQGQQCAANQAVAVQTGGAGFGCRCVDK